MVNISTAKMQTQLMLSTFLEKTNIQKMIYECQMQLSPQRQCFLMARNFKKSFDKEINLNQIAELTKNYVSSDISFLVNEASRNALKERANISMKHFEEAINKYPPSVSERQLKKYEAFKNNRNFV